MDPSISIRTVECPSQVALTPAAPTNRLVVLVQYGPIIGRLLSKGQSLMGETQSGLGMAESSLENRKSADTDRILGLFLIHQLIHSSPSW